MYVTAVSLVCVLSLVSGNVLYFKPHNQQDEVVTEFDQDRDDSPDIIVYDPVLGHESRVPQKEKTAVTEQPFGAVMCPDGISECPDDTTCCKLASGHYGCCPFPDAVCCTDMKHCCRHGYTCNLSKGRCEQGNSIMPLISKLPASKHIHSQNENTGSPRMLEGSMIAEPLEICPGGEQACESGYSCCMNTNNTYSCCGYSPAHCCDDKVHCCPAYYKCLSTGLCEDRNGFQLPRSRKVEATTLKVKANIVCPDKSQCTEGKTCCMKGVNIYGCCPLKNAVCCTDKKHCCPFGYKCGPKIGTCMQGYHVIDLTVENNIDLSKELTPDPKVAVEEKTESQPMASSNVICPDGQSQCQAGNTCCLQAGGGYGCCPEPNAVCCADKVHCCPEGYKCDTGKGQCIQGDHLIDWLEKSQSIIMSKPAGVSGQHLCPDHLSVCNPGQTCCKMTGQLPYMFGCCPLPQGVCCGDSDGHCCPEGYTCNVLGQNCKKDGTEQVIEWLTKIKSNSKSLQNVVCPDGKSECPTGNTCCLGTKGRYGCCPQSNAVCCPDKKHCCQENTKCDATSQRCIHPNGLLTDWLEKSESQPMATSSDVICPDDKSQCPAGNTCCRVKGGKYGCCARPNAVCCSDMKHCCPEHTTCNTGAGTCKGGNGLLMDWFEKTESRPVARSPDVICPGGKSQCPSGNTCCLVGPNKYGCCPRSNAVCCSDMKHCCPEHTTCDTGAGTCKGGNGLLMDWFEKTESRPVARSPDVICPDGKSECPSGNTCCLVGPNKYGCCPRSNAVCCSDMKHCCPEHTTCDTGAGTCKGGNGLLMDWFEKTESRPVARSPDVICPDGKSECPSGNTCCLVGPNKYGCCPRSNAVCCSDMKHCCPEHTTCDTGAGTCKGGNGLLMDWLEKSESQPTATSSDVICPDDKSQCPAGNTCCRVEGGKYGCCARPNAVCCSDMKHCCPEHTTCDTGAGTCKGGNGLLMDWFEKTESRPVARSPDVMCPDGKSECPSGNTCCLVGPNKYGCCPRSNAVCCSDMKHCCPEHTTCDTGAGTCKGGNGLLMDWLEKSESQPTATSSDVICPDDKSQCPAGNTCCRVEGGKYGCCARPNAVCCSDMKHCCPEHTTCDTGAGTCKGGNGLLMDWFEKTESRPVARSPDVICPDGKSECPSGNTCCLVGPNKYGCCPRSNAVCCSDMKHCCPEHTTCNTGAGTCKGGNGLLMDWFEKTESRPVARSPDVICPDGKSECPSGNTCCLVGPNKYGCCPRSNAVCCSDMKHCCPEHTTCDTGAGTCKGGNGLLMDWFEKTESRPVARSPDVICPDGKSECPSGNTCCLVGANKYGCCPQPNAVCCDDEKHCCPAHTTCDTGSGKCKRGNGLLIDWFEKTESLPVARSPDVICPDGKSECPSGNTCCLVGPNKYGCCPQPNAVCCDDEKHCCPEHTTCDTGSGKCQRGNGLLIDWFEKTESLPVARSPDVICPGGTSECPSGNTCCLVGPNKYGCCPRSNAVCCSDMKHCCPEHTTCDTGAGTCKGGNGLLMDWFVKTESRPVARSPDVICPDGKSECPSGNTCCLVGANKYGCCPQPNAVCCDDEKHCCPAHTTCDTGSGKCKRGNGLLIDWFEKTESLPVARSPDVICPDGKSECPSGNTCCLVGPNKYGCCPQPNAVCCDDEKHCCPAHTTCDTGSGKCKRGNGLLIDWFEKTESLPVARSPDVICPDGKSECPSGNTCCLVGPNKYGCCPQPNAVCCDDEKHCCPAHTTCDTGSGKCKRGDGLLIDWFEKTESLPVARSPNVICPDGKSECPSGNTCCLVGANKYGCCPQPNAVCCDDEKHCCPAHTTCDTGSGKCKRGNGLLIDWFEKTESLPVARSPNVICPDGKSDCPSGNTCCLVGANKYGCCPQPNAVCCDDEKHCCPAHTTCDTGSGKCKRGNGLLIDWFEKTESLPVARSPNVICPDGKSECPSGNTCCLVGANKYGCCPQPNAVCCDDEKHCCPAHTTCDTGSGKCKRGNGLLIDWFEKTESLPVARSPNVICPDGKSECPSGNTCCLVGANKYGCCPQPNAVCCDDEKHCCPAHTTCDTGSGKCKRGNGLLIDWFEKTESLPVARSPNVICPDGKSECPSGNTCCLVGANKYGCCPQPNAVCCDDEKHCCPAHTTCDTGSGKCKRGNGLLIDWFEKTESLPVARSPNVICPDGKSECPSGNTCCLVGANKYGCCPQPNAVCCDDEKHCCPAHTTCDTGSGKCKRGNGLLIDWFEKTESLPVARSPNVICPDGKSECPSGNTCCLVGANKYGCCPQPNAVCCDDEKHCCPAHTTCDTGSGKCKRGNGLLIDWFEKTESLPVARSPNVICPDGKSECPSGNTCCLVGANKYGCCPQPNAVCCDDEKHCCPENTTCDTGSGKCKRGNGLLMDWFEKTESRPVARSPQVICPDGKSECPSGNTCCLVGPNKYGCCPRSNAVCCSDMKHCCPEHTTCDTGAGTCKGGNGLLMDWFEKTESRPVARSPQVICPDGKSECPSSNTCCLVGANKYGCCPQPNAVCCDDKKHCCPENTTCDTGSGKCKRGNGLLMNWFGKTESVLIENDSPTFAVLVPTTYTIDQVSSSVDCPGGGSCPDTNTCCKDTTGKYGCCPYAKAVCCADGKYCCPHDYICDTEPMICRMPEGITRQDFNTNLFLQRIANKHRQLGGKH